MCADWAKINYSLGMVNMMLSGLDNYRKDIRSNNPYANMNFTNSIMSGMVRNNVAYDMALRGNLSGQVTNAMLGFNNPVNNNFAHISLFYQNMATPPFMFGNPMMSPYTMGPGMFLC